MSKLSDIGEYRIDPPHKLMINERWGTKLITNAAQVFYFVEDTKEEVLDLAIRFANRFNDEYIHDMSIRDKFILAWQKGELDGQE